MAYNPFALDGKTVLVTGASSGIGRAVAIECSKLGAHVVLNGRNEEALKETLGLLQGDGHCIIPAELTDEAQRDALVAALPPLDGASLNAGISKMQPLQFVGLPELEHTFNVNTFAPMLLLRQLVKKKKLKNPSSVVFTASISGHTNTAVANGVYGASKSALTAFMKYAALELCGKGIRCNSVHPGRVLTPLIANKPISAEDLEKDIARYPLRRYGSPEDVAWAIVYLLSDASAWVTGTSIVVDGGRSI